MVALALGVEATFVEWSASQVAVCFTAEVASYFPDDGDLGKGQEGVIEYTARVLVAIGTDEIIVVEAHVVEEDGEDVLRFWGETGKGEC